MDAPVARDTRQVVHQRQLAADETIEQRGLADIGTPDDSESETHERKLLQKETGPVQDQPRR